MIPEFNSQNPIQRINTQHFKTTSPSSLDNKIVANAQLKIQTDTIAFNTCKDRLIYACKSLFENSNNKALQVAMSVIFIEYANRCIAYDISIDDFEKNIENIIKTSISKSSLNDTYQKLLLTKTNIMAKKWTKKYSDMLPKSICSILTSWLNSLINNYH